MWRDKASVRTSMAGVLELLGREFETIVINTAEGANR